MVEMTPRERLLAAIRFDGPDRVPIAVTLYQIAYRRMTERSRTEDAL